MACLGNCNLNYVNVAKNNFGDAGLKPLLDAMSAARGKVPETFSVQGCGISAKGFKTLSDSLRGAQWSSTLKVLDVSDNRSVLCCV